MFRKSTLLILFTIVCIYVNTNRPTRIDWDVFGYYLYLPAQFIYHDIHLDGKEKWLTPLIDSYSATGNFYQANEGPKNLYVMKYTMGLSFVYAPFFFIADFIALPLGCYRDGLSPPYQWSLFLCGLLFSLIGIFYLMKILNIYFNEKTTIITAAFIVFGTNYFVMSTNDSLMPHNFIFTFFAIMLYNTIKWYENQQIKNAVIIGFCIGISVLIRPTSIVVIIIPLLWNIKTIKDIKNRISVFIKNYSHLFMLGLTAFLVVLPQLIYWKSVTGDWFYYSYPDEKINLFHPHLKEVFLSYKKGWLLYTPLMAFAITGFINLYKDKKELFYSLFIFFIINAYLISCWECWWYGGSFAERPFVESYVFMAFPLAAFINATSFKKYYLIIPLLSIGLFLTFLNLFQTWQATHYVLHTTRTTKEYYWRIFLKTKATDEDIKWLLPTEYYGGKDEFNSSLSYTTKSRSDLLFKDRASVLDKDSIYSRFIISPCTFDYSNSDCYLKSTIEVDTSAENLLPGVKAHLVSSINRNGGLFKYRATDFDYSEIKKKEGKIELVMLIPPNVNEKEFEMRSFVYIDGETKLKLISLNTKILRKEN